MPTRRWCSRSFHPGWPLPGDTLAILGILLASGQVSSSLFSNGIRAVWRRTHALRPFSRSRHSQPEPELLGLARAGSDSVAPGRRRSSDPAHRHALSHHDLFLLEPRDQQHQHSRAHQRGHLQQPLVAALFLAGSASTDSAGGVPGPGPDAEGHSQGDAQRRRRAHRST